jgi:hypothetical protein
MARLPLQTAARAGTVALVNGYRTANSLDLGQVYRARPKQIAVPSVFIDRISEDADAFTREESQRTVRVSVRIVWGLYDAGEAVDHYHAFGGNAECNWIGVTDDPFWTPEWIEGDEERYMTEITLEGRAST